MSRSGTAFIGLRALVYAVLFLGFWFWLAWWAHLRTGWLGVQLPGWIPALWIPVAAIGAGLVVASVATFVVRGRGTPAPFDPPREFVASGPYRWIRNPMYLGGFLLLAGYALCAGSFEALLVAFGMLATTHLVAVFYEEPSLRRRFGAGYEAYLESTGRWWPRRRGAGRTG